MATGDCIGSGSKRTGRLASRRAAAGQATVSAGRGSAAARLARLQARRRPLTDWHCALRAASVCGTGKLMRRLASVARRPIQRGRRRQRPAHWQPGKGCRAPATARLTPAPVGAGLCRPAGSSCPYADADASRAGRAPSPLPLPADSEANFTGWVGGRRRPPRAGSGQRRRPPAFPPPPRSCEWCGDQAKAFLCRRRPAGA